MSEELDNLLERASLLESSEKVEEAINTYSEILAKKSDHWKALERRATLYHESFEMWTRLGENQEFDLLPTDMKDSIS